VLPNAPETHVGHEFSTHTMNIIDKILSELGHAKDGLGPNWSGIERVAHKFHMWDLWHKVTLIRRTHPRIDCSLS